MIQKEIEQQVDIVYKQVGEKILDKMNKRLNSVNCADTTKSVKIKNQYGYDITNCLRCGTAISNYYFTHIKTESGIVVHPRCPNCGFYDDPE